MTIRLIATLLILIIGQTSTFSPASSTDRHEGYYYPNVTSQEIYEAKTKALPDSDKRRRVGFIVGMTDEQQKRAYAPQFAIFAKGEFAEKLIIVSLQRDYLATLAQARAFLAQLTAQSRASELFRELGVSDTFTFWDLAAMLGFKQATISNGIDYTHQVKIE